MTLEEIRSESNKFMELSEGRLSSNEMYMLNIMRMALWGCTAEICERLGSSPTDVESMTMAKAHVMVQDEREACAKIVEDYVGTTNGIVAKKIRARGKAT